MSPAFGTAAELAAEVESLRKRITELEDDNVRLRLGRSAAADREARYHSIVDNQTEIICRVDRDLVIRFVNRAFRDYFDKSNDELIGSHYLDFLSPQMRDQARLKLVSLFQLPEVASHVCEVMRTAGQAGWQHAMLTPILDAGGEVVELQVVARIRTTRKQAEYEIENTEIVNGQLAKIMKDGLIVVDPRGLITSVNQQLCQIAGLRMEDLVGRSMWDVVGPENRKILTQEFRDRRDGGAAQYEMTWDSGLGRRVSAIFSPTHLCNGEGRFDGSLSVVTDITERRDTEIQLRESERLLAASQKIARLGSFEWKFDEEAVIWSEELYRIHGRSPETFTPTKASFFEGVHPDDRAKVEQQFQDVRREQPTDALEYRILRSDGAERWVELTRWLMRGEEGKPSGIIGTVRDINSQKQAKMILEERESILRSFYESGLMLMGVVELDQQDIRWISENAATARYLNMAPDALHNKTLRDVGIGEEENGLWVSKIREAQQSGETVRFEYQRPEDPKQAWLAVNVTMIGRSPDGKPRFSYVCDDITDRKRVEAEIQAAHDALEVRVQERTAELLDANQQLRFHAQLLDSVRESVVATDLEGRIVYWGKGAEMLYGYSQEEAVGQQITSVARTDGPEVESRRMAHVLETGSWHGEFRQYHKDGGKFWVETVMSLVNNPQGKPTGVIAIDRDVTLRRQAEERTRQLHADLAHVLRLGTMGEMASGLAHEINQPLGTIANNSHAVVRGLRNDSLPSEEVLEIIEEIAGEAMRAGEILHSLHRFTSKAAPDRTVVDLPDLVREAARLFDSESRRQKIKLRLDLDETLPKVFVERIQIQQVIVNLVRNAFDALLEEECEVREVTIRAALEEDVVFLSIIDTGKKLSSEVFNQFFSPYFTTKKNGMGMGLSICRSIVSSHGGHLGAIQNPEGGMTFTFALPVVEPGDEIV